MTHAMKTSKKTKTAPRAKARPIAKKVAKKVAAKTTVEASKPAATVGQEKHGFMWKLLERKKAALEARRKVRPATPYESKYAHFAASKKRAG